MMSTKNRIRLSLLTSAALAVKAFTTPLCSWIARSGLNARQTLHVARLSSSSSSSSSHSFTSPSVLSSPGRYAASLGLTVTEVEARKSEHAAACIELRRVLNSTGNSEPLLADEEKNVLRCRHRLKFGHHPFVCRKCWAYQPICVCSRASAGIGPRALPVGLELAVWVNSDEWGLTSNTGGLLSLTLTPCMLLMHGLPEHDAWLRAKLTDPAVDAVVLWPSRTSEGDGNHGGGGDDEEVEQGKHDRPRRTTLAELRQRLASPLYRRLSLRDANTTTSTIDSIASSTTHASGASKTEALGAEDRTVLLIAVDSTWRAARKMLSRLPASVERLGLDPADVFFSSSGGGEEEEKGDHEAGRAPGTSAMNTATSANSAVASSAQPAKSLLYPLRRRRGGGAGDCCTAEAAVGALVGLGLPTADAAHVLDVTRAKVSLTVKYRGKQAR